MSNSWAKYLFLKAAEEASEVSKESIKVALFGNKSGDYDNLKQFVKEFVELATVFEMIVKELEDADVGSPFSEEELNKIAGEKRARLLSYFSKSEVTYANIETG